MDGELYERLAKLERELTGMERKLAALRDDRASQSRQEDEGASRDAADAPVERFRLPPPFPYKGRFAPVLKEALAAAFQRPALGLCIATKTMEPAGPLVLCPDPDVSVQDGALWIDPRRSGTLTLYEASGRVEDPVILVTAEEGTPLYAISLPAPVDARDTVTYGRFHICFDD